MFALAASLASKGASLAMTYASSTLGPISVPVEVVASIDEALEQTLEAASALALATATKVVKTAAAICCCGATPDDGELVEVVEAEKLVVEGDEVGVESQWPLTSAAGVVGQAGKSSGAPALIKTWAPLIGDMRLEQNLLRNSTPCLNLPSPPTTPRPSRPSPLVFWVPMCSKTAVTQPPASTAPRRRPLRSNTFKVERPFASANGPALSQEDGRAALPSMLAHTPSALALAPHPGKEQSRTSLLRLKANKRSNQPISGRPQTQTVSAKVRPAGTIKGCPWDLPWRKEWNDLSGEDLFLALFDKL